MKKWIKKNELEILKGILALTVISAITITTVETIKSMEAWNDYATKFVENLPKQKCERKLKRYKKEIKNKIINKGDW